MRKSVLFPTVILSAVALAVPTVATAKPSIGVSNSPSCSGFSFVASQPGDAFTSGKYTVTAQEYDSETITPSGAEQVFTGSVTWGETVNVTIPVATDYLLWTYRVDASADGEGLTTYGERQLDCLPTETPEPEPEPEPEEPGVPLTPLEPSAPIETPEPEVPETSEVSEVETPEATTTPVVTRETTSVPTGGAVPVKATPKTVG